MSLSISNGIGIGLGGGAVAARDPASIVTSTTKVAWFEQGVQTVTSTGAVDSITDLLGNGHVLANTTTARPTYSASDAGFNNLPACLNDGVSQYLFNSGSLANTLCGGNDREFSIYLVMRFVTIPAALAGIVAASSSASSSYKDALCHSAATSMQNLRQAGDTQTAPTGGTPAINTTYLIRKHFVANATTVKLNGTTVINASAQDQATMSTLLDRFSIGALLLAGPAAFFGNIKWASLLLTLGKPNPAEDAELGTYFGTKYAFTAG